MRSLAGKNTPLHTRNRLYVDIVLRAIPFLPQTMLCHPQESLNATLQHFDIDVLDIVDVVVSKSATLCGFGRSTSSERTTSSPPLGDASPRRALDRES